MQQIVTVTFFSYIGIRNKNWGMSQMFLVREAMRQMAGVSFFKPLGTGGGAGYSLMPDFGVYGLLVVWKDISFAEDFLKSTKFDEFRMHSAEQYTVFMTPVLAKGSWSGFSDWQVSADTDANAAVAVITYATIRKGFIIPFLRNTPKVSKVSEGFQGLVFSKGIGEKPIGEQATFTVWENVTHVEQFAYRGKHLEAMRLTRAKKGFTEELFARFKPLKAVGTYQGTNPVQELLDKQQADT
jgi:hypothetical protein